MANEELIMPENPKSIGLLTNNDILFGTPIPAIDKLKIVSPDEYEDIVREWIAGYCQKKYIGVRKVGGANDKGRDVIAFINNANDYDNYQCKHYDHPLAPSDIWKEIGKLCYYTFDGSYQLPQNYFFVAPQGIGPKLSDYLQNPTEFKTEFFKEWDSKCKNGLSDKVEIELSETLITHINSIDFSIFKSIDPQEFIEQHRQTNYYAARFGGGLKRREKPVIKTLNETEMHLRYIEQLFQAYSDYLQMNVHTISELSSNNELFNHFNRQRECFYWAEALNEFSRDSLPANNNCFEELKEEIFYAVVDISNQEHSNGYENVKKTTIAAIEVNIQSNALLSVSKTQDKVGICHHLANENKLIWVKS